jgi:hypothetical protein
MSRILTKQIIPCKTYTGFFKDGKKILKKQVYFLGGVPFIKKGNKRVYDEFLGVQTEGVEQ